MSLFFFVLMFKKNFSFIFIHSSLISGFFFPFYTLILSFFLSWMETKGLMEERDPWAVLHWVFSPIEKNQPFLVSVETFEWAKPSPLCFCSFRADHVWQWWEKSDDLIWSDLIWDDQLLVFRLQLMDLPMTQLLSLYILMRWTKTCWLSNARLFCPFKCYN